MTDQAENTTNDTEALDLFMEKPKGYIEPEYTHRLFFRRRIFQVKINVGKTPAERIRLAPTADYFYMDTKGWSKKMWLKYVCVVRYCLLVYMFVVG